MYKCDTCGAVFNEPRVTVSRENLDGENGWETRKEVICPDCESPHFKETEDLEDECGTDSGKAAPGD